MKNEVYKCHKCHSWIAQGYGEEKHFLAHYSAEGFIIGSFWAWLQEKADEAEAKTELSEGVILLNTVDNELYVRLNGVWKTVG